MHLEQRQTGVDGTAGQCADGDAMWGVTALAVSPDSKDGLRRLVRERRNGRVESRPDFGAPA